MEEVNKSPWEEYDLATAGVPAHARPAVLAALKEMWEGGYVLGVADTLQDQRIAKGDDQE